MLMSRVVCSIQIIPAGRRRPLIGGMVWQQSDIRGTGKYLGMKERNVLKTLVAIAAICFIASMLGIVGMASQPTNPTGETVANTTGIDSTTHPDGMDFAMLGALAAAVS